MEVLFPAEPGEHLELRQGSTRRGGEEAPGFWRFPAHPVVAAPAAGNSEPAWEELMGLAPSETCVEDQCISGGHRFIGPWPPGPMAGCCDRWRAPVASSTAAFALSRLRESARKKCGWPGVVRVGTSQQPLRALPVNRTLAGTSAGVERLSGSGGIASAWFFPRAPAPIAISA